MLESIELIVPIQDFVTGDLVHDVPTGTTRHVLECELSDEGTFWTYRLDVPLDLLTDDYPNGWRYDAEVVRIIVKDGDW